MKKRAWMLGAALALSTLTFVGCGNQDTNNSTTDQGSVSPGTDGAGTNEKPDVSPDNNGAIDDLEDGAKDAAEGVGDAVDDVVDDLDGDAEDGSTNR